MILGTELIDLAYTPFLLWQCILKSFPLSLCFWLLSVSSLFPLLSLSLSLCGFSLSLFSLSSLLQQQTEVVEELEYQISLLNEEKQSLADYIKKLQRCVCLCACVERGWGNGSTLHYGVTGGC